MSDIDLAALAADVRYLKDRAGILEALNCYTRGLDRIDRELLLRAYHPHARDDRGSAYDPRGADGGNNSMSVEERADWLIDIMHGFRHTAHYITNFTLDIQGDEAHSECYVITHTLPLEGDTVTFGGARYVDRLEKIDGRWALAHREVVMDFQSTVPTIDLPPDVIGGVRDRSDRSYARPLTVA